MNPRLFVDDLNDSINDAIIRERNQDMQQIEKDIGLIAEIQRDLAMLVYSQGENLEIAEENVETATINVKEANENLQSAATIQKKTNKLFVGGLLTSVGVAAGGGLIALASPIAGIVIAGCGIVSSVVIIVAKVST